jgi:hypothetical protein
MCFKKKKNSDIANIEAIQEINDFLFDIVSKINNKTEQNIYYFSAHLHQYQSGTVTLTRENQEKQEKITIHQYISGTGGAHLDPEIKESDNKEKTESYKMEKSIESHGFSLIDINSDGKLNVDFIEIKTGGKKTRKTKKTRRIRRKTKKSKRN